MQRYVLFAFLSFGLSGSLWAQTSEATDPSRELLDVEHTGLAVALGAIAGQGSTAPVRSIFNLANVGLLIAGIQADNANRDLNIARDSGLPVSSESDAAPINLRRFGYTWRFSENWALVMRGKFNTYRETTETLGPLYETPGYQFSRPLRTEGSATISYGRTFRVFLGYTGDQLTTPLSRVQAGRIGWRVGRGRLRQTLEGGEVAFGVYPVLFRYFQLYGKLTLGGGAGRISYRLTTYGQSEDPRNDAERAEPGADPDQFLRTDYLEVVQGKMELESVYAIAEAGVFIRIGERLALRLGGFYQGYTYFVPRVQGNLYALDLKSQTDQLTPLEYVPTDVLENVDFLSGAVVAVVVRF